ALNYRTDFKDPSNFFAFRFLRSTRLLLLQRAVFAITCYSAEPRIIYRKQRLRQTLLDLSPPARFSALQHHLR
ncbi:MAG TPA: hypothetical protein VLJ86_16895, partial [Ramlibacter sp.]|nr:hypothetical protein [Ramlibacter sp.]